MAAGAFGVLKVGFLVIVYSYGVWYGALDVISSFMPLGLIPALLILLAMRLLRISQPPQAQVEKIVGKDCFQESNDNNIQMRSIAHRGCGLDAPENSLIAFQMCKERGQKFVEFDVALTKDGIPIVFHDESLNRMCNINRKVSDCTWEELKDIDISVNHPHHSKFKGTTIPLLATTVKQLLESGQNMFIDLKANDLRMVNVVIELYAKYPELTERAVVTSFFPTLLYLIRKSNHHIVCSMAYRPYFFSHKSYAYPHGLGPRRAKTLWQHLLNVGLNFMLTWCMNNISYYMIGLSLVLLHKDCISPQIILEWHSKGVRVCAWSVNHIAEKQYFGRILKCTYFTDTMTGESSTHMQPVQNDTNKY